jgi:cytochrome c oxidase subunit I+III
LQLPTVTGSHEPLWEHPEDAPKVEGLSTAAREVLVTTLHTASPHHRQHLAGDSWWPFLVALGAGETLIHGLIFNPIGVVIGLAILLVAIPGWLWPTREPHPLPRPVYGDVPVEP